MVPSKRLSLFVLLIFCLTTIESAPAFAGKLTDAVKARDVAQVRSLLAAGEDVQEKVHGGYPLNVAAVFGPPETVVALLEAGADIVNDISALRMDPAMIGLVARSHVPVVMMHMLGTPGTMQKNPIYKDVVGEVLDFLLERARRAEGFGIPKERIFIDPGIGFGKTLEHNIELLRNISRFVASGYRVLVGTSRKSFIGRITGKETASERIFGTAATVGLCATAGVSIVRVHDTAEMIDVVKVSNLLKSPKNGGFCGI